MTKNGHKLVGFWTAIPSSLYIYQQHFPLSVSILVFIAVYLGATAPDDLERFNGRQIIKHRTYTHWCLLWFIFTFAMYYIYHYYDKYFLIGFFYGVGAITHLFADLPNPQGVPVFTPNRRFSLNLWQSGKNEKPIVWVLGAISLFVSFRVLSQ